VVNGGVIDGMELEISDPGGDYLGVSSEKDPIHGESLMETTQLNDNDNSVVLSHRSDNLA
jgi:hypothetical protein